MYSYMNILYEFLVSFSYMTNFVLRVHLQPTPDQAKSLQELQRAFAEVCNALVPKVLETRCWSRVALHHMAYRELRERFPKVGSQMICNAIYSVSRTCRTIFQGHKSPFNVERRVGKPLPTLMFLANAPVYFDRHTLSIKRGALSMYSLDGRLRLDVNLLEQDEDRFNRERVQEVVLMGAGEKYTLSIKFGAGSPNADGLQVASQELNAYQYVQIKEDEIDEFHQAAFMQSSGGMDHGQVNGGVNL